MQQFPSFLRDEILVTHTLVTVDTWDYCNVFYMGLALKNIWKLQAGSECSCLGGDGCIPINLGDLINKLQELLYCFWDLKGWLSPETCLAPDWLPDRLLSFV